MKALSPSRRPDQRFEHAFARRNDEAGTGKVLIAYPICLIPARRIYRALDCGGEPLITSSAELCRSVTEGLRMGPWCSRWCCCPHSNTWPLTTRTPFVHPTPILSRCTANRRRCSGLSLHCRSCAPKRDCRSTMPSAMPTPVLTGQPSL